MKVIQPTPRILSGDHVPYPSSKMEQADLAPLSYRRKYLWQAKKWQAIENVPKKSGFQADSAGSLTVITYNIWFESRNNEIRHAEIISLISGLGADVVCLQEVTPAFLERLTKHRYVQKNWICSDLTGVTHGEFHGCLMLADKDTVTVKRITKVDMPGGQESQLSRRKMIVMEIEGRAGTRTEGVPSVRIATAHLQSPGMSQAREARERQLKEAYTIMSHDAVGAPASPSTSNLDNATLPRGIFCGDTNLSEDGEDELPSQIGFGDAWIQARSRRGSGYTNRINYPDGRLPTRIDRLLTVGNIHTSRAATFGDEPIAISSTVKEFPSDHIGVVATFYTGTRTGPVVVIHPESL